MTVLVGQQVSAAQDDFRKSRVAWFQLSEAVFGGSCSV